MDAELPTQNRERLASSRENMHSVMQAIQKLQRFFDRQAHRTHEQAKDFTEMSSILKQLHMKKQVVESKVYLDVAIGCMDKAAASENYIKLEQNTICNQLSLLAMILKGYLALCDRVEHVLAESHPAGTKKTVKKSHENANHIQENKVPEISILESQQRRANFSLHCALNEGSLVQRYLTILPSILLTFASEEAELHSKVRKMG
jgi:hypothetical protein